MWIKRTCLLALVVGLAGCNGAPPPELGQLPERRECPREWVWGPTTEDTTHGQIPPNWLLAVPSGTLSGPGPIQNVPEFHDCQRFLKWEGPDLVFDSLFAIFAVEQTRQAMAATLEEGRDSSVYDNFPGKGLPAAEIVAWGSWTDLSIDPGFSCLYLWKRGASWHSRMVGFGNVEKDCSQPVDTTWAKMNGDPLPVIPDMPGTFPPPDSVNDIPAVARWVWNPRTHRYSIGIWCDVGWCGVGLAGPPVRSFAERFDNPGELPPGLAKVYGLRGWHDEQILADRVPEGPFFSTGILGTLIPHPELGNYTQDDPFVPGQWVQAAEVALADPNGNPWTGPNPYKAKLNLEPVGTTGERRLNQVWLCRGRWDECGAAEPSAPESLAPCGDSLWWGKIVSAVSQDVRYQCVDRCDHSDLEIPGTARWRWSKDDEGMWMRCVNGCCEITPPPNGDGGN